TGTSTTTPHSRERAAWILVAAIALIASSLGYIAYSGRTSVKSVVSRFSMELPSDTSLTQGSVVALPYPAISPNGRFVLFVLPSAGSQRLWLRPIDSVTAQMIPGTEGVTQYPFWSPDSRFVGFVAGGKLKKVSISGGAPQVLCDADTGGGTWGPDDL